MTLTRIADLIGKDVAGKRADIRSRFADGSFMYSLPEYKEPRMVTLTRVHVKKKNHESVLYWEWEGRGHQLPLACGFSGIVMDGKSELEYHIEIEEGN